MISVEPERMTELRALVAARLAMVEALAFLPPVTELTMLRLSELMTEEVALVTAFCAVFLRCSASFSLAFCSAAADRRI